MSRVKETGSLLDVPVGVSGDSFSVVPQACKTTTPMTTIMRAELDLNIRMVVSPVPNGMKRMLPARRGNQMSQNGPKTAHLGAAFGELNGMGGRTLFSIRTLALKALDGDRSEEPLVELRDSCTD